MQKFFAAFWRLFSFNIGKIVSPKKHEKAPWKLLLFTDIPILEDIQAQYPLEFQISLRLPSIVFHLVHSRFFPVEREAQGIEEIIFNHKIYAWTAAEI